MSRFRKWARTAVLALGVGSGGVAFMATADAADAVAVSSANGQFGFGNGRNTTSAATQAVANCQGPAPRVIAQSAANGWCAVARSKNAAGQWVFGAAVALPTQRDAVAAAQKQMLLNGGSIDPKRGFSSASMLLNQY